MMFTVEGPTNRVVVVGAGLGGLSAAMRLAGAGREVTLLEREQVPGGRAGRLQADGYSFDTGPTVLTMPDLIDDAFAALGEDYRQWLDLIPLDPAYRAFYPDGSSLDVFADPERMAAEIETRIGPEEAAGYRRFVDYVATMYSLEIRDFMDRNIDSPLDLLTPNLARLVALGGFGRLQSKVDSFLKDPAASSPSRRCMPDWPRTKPWRSTPSSPTWTRSPVSSCPAAGCTPSRRPWRRRRRSTGSRSTTASRSTRWRRTVTARRP
jgi:phytoene desaturase